MLPRRLAPFAALAVLAPLLVTGAACLTPDPSASAPVGGAAALLPEAVAPSLTAAPTDQTDAPPEIPGPQPGLLAGRRICIDPGHDAYWVVGASGYGRAGFVPRHPVEGIPLHEHELTLSVAYRLKGLLETEGAEVCVTRRPREEGGGLQVEPYDFTGDGRVRTAAFPEDGPERIQPRVDWANAFGAEVLLSIHFNGSEDRSLRGSEVYFSDTGPRETENRDFAGSVLAGLLSEYRDAGAAAVDRGLRSDRYQRYSASETARLIEHNAAAIRRNGADPAACRDCLRLLTLGNNPMSLHMGTYTAALIEVEFLSNPDVVESFILRPDALDVIARGLARGILAYFSNR